MIQEVCILLVVLIITLIIVSVVKKPKGMPPCPASLPILGNLLEVAGWIKARNMHLELTKIAKENHWNIFSLQVPGQNIVVVNSASIAREALLTKRDDFAGRPYQFSLDYLTCGSKDIAVQDFTHTLRAQRKIVHSAIRMYQPHLADKANREAEELAKRLIAHQEKPIDPLRDIILTTMNIICAMVYGERYEIDDPEFQMILDETKKLNEIVGGAFLLNSFPFLIHFPISDSKLVKSIKETAISRVTRKYLEHQQTYQDGNTRDLTDALIKALKESEREDKTSYDMITKDHVLMTMGDAFTAGFETTCSTILWFLIFMIRHPDVQAKIHAELDSICAKDKLPNWEKRNILPYTCASIDETHRLASVSPLLLPHKAKRHSSLDGYNIPMGTTVLINGWAIHHDEAEWINPHNFQPERFLDSEGKLIQLSGVKSFLPFGSGHRACVGETLAKQELFVVITRLLHQFRVEAAVPGSPPTTEGELKVALVPKPFKVIFKHRFK